jgi:Protein of unknown function (DUF2971)
MTDEPTWQRHREALKAASVQYSTSAVELPELLFHYTSAESCFSIIQTPEMSDGGPKLWASCVLGMNDENEIRYGISLVHEIARKFVPQEELDRSFAAHWKHGEYAKLSLLERTCVACLCDKPDLLSQWRAYGKGATGYCLGFRRPILSSAGLKAGFELVPITYEREHQMEKVQKVFEEALAILERDHPQPEWLLWRTAVDAAVNLALGFKHACFSEEREWRLISPNPQSLKFRAGRWGIIPYVEIPLAKDCLAEIWQGPTLDHDLTRRTLEMYLMRRYGSGVQVCRSEITLRDA